FLAWTTTPWTLASNVALTVGPNIDYVKARIKDGAENHAGKVVYVAKKLADKVLGADTYDVFETVKGSALEYIEYEQLMPFVDVYSYGKPGAKAFFITVADYATDEDGTGIVHTAPAFGEDDYNTGRRYGLPVANPVDEEGHYTTTPWQGRFVMAEGLDVDIIKWLASEGKLFSREKIDHNYPFCWRCDTPLIYYSKPGWYIEMTKLKDELVKNNSFVHWFPDYVGEKRFGNWLENVNDWAISRTRYWGTPIPVWRCPDCGGLTCVGSRAELREKAIEEIPLRADGVPDIELHRPYVDDIHIKCDACGGRMERIPEVMDCWFDSGSMPYGQQHYPFEHEDEFYERLFPADFICEGIDQTRGWFYSLMAISTFIEKDRVRKPGERAAQDGGRASYRNCLVNDLILDKYGKKMSKTRGNTVDPFEMFDKYGADATRWYLLQTSPAWSPTKFDEDGLAEVQGKFFGTLRNIYHFFVLYANQDGVDPREYEVDYASSPELDRWILSKYENLIQGVIADMDKYDHMKAARRIQEFTIEEFSNWYIRRARRRFWAEELTDDKKSVYAVTYEILAGLARLMAPMAPFISDEIYTKLTGEDSVHLAFYPAFDESLVDEGLEEKMDLVRVLVGLGRGAREKERIKVRQPLPAVLIDAKYEPLIGGMSDLIKEELNIKEVRFLTDIADYIDFSVKPDFKAAGPKLGARMKAFAASLAKADAPAVIVAAEEATEDEPAYYSLTGNAVVSAGDAQGSPDEVIAFDRSFLDIRVNAKEGFAVAMERDVFAILDTTLTDELTAEGIAREFVSKVQQLRKQAGFEMMDTIRIAYDGDAEVDAVVRSWTDYIMKETLAVTLISEKDADAKKYDLNGHETALLVEKI
ncbi:MAG: isoleucine--tRNA ligase, partial [Clostridiales Family XIII bacterium]|nr:isoleucine--tRNA ligase [Clostridiales Family XIII bacterium]